MRTLTGKPRAWAFLRAILLCCAVLGGNAAVDAQTNLNSNANASASPDATPAPTPIPLPEILREAERTSERLRSIDTNAAELPTINAIEQQLPSARALIRESEPAAMEVLNANPSLDQLRAVEQTWQGILRPFPAWEDSLRNRIADLDAIVAELDGLKQLWQESLAALQGSADANTNTPLPAAAAPDVPPEIARRVNELVAEIDASRERVERRRAALISLQTRVIDTESVVTRILEQVRSERERTLTNLFDRDADPIWSPAGKMSGSELLTATRDSVATQFSALREYFQQRSGRFGIHAGLFVLLTIFFYWARRRIRPYAEREPELQKAAEVFAVPIISALIVAIIFSAWFYPQAPRVLTSVVWAIALIPIVILLRRLVERPLFLILDLLVVLYFTDRLRELLAGQELASRLLFMAELAGAAIFLAWFLRTRRVERNVEARHHRTFRFIRRVIPFAILLLAAAFLANAAGFVSLSNVLGNGLFGSAYAALVIYTAALILRSVAIFALRVPPLSRLKAVEGHRPLVRAKFEKVVYWAAIVLWFVVALNAFAVRDTVFDYVRSIFTYTFNIGSFGFSIGDILLVAAMIWAAVIISRLLRFFLEEDVYPRVDLGGGVSYAVSTVLHYAILVGGFLIAVAALGVDFTKFAIIAGAVGIGIGFGLQNIINNFVSGLILLFERPVKIGDTVQIGEHTGTLKEIGLRASVLKTFTGSDIIIPNSMLISEEVTNWTHSDEVRRLDIPVGVAYGTDTARVFELLEAIPKRYEETLQDPEPIVLFSAMGESSLDFELRVWVPESGWLALRSKLVNDVYNDLTKAGIEIPFPQRDLNVRNVDEKAAKALKGSKGS